MDCVIKRWLFIIPTCFLNWTHGQLFQELRRKKASSLFLILILGIWGTGGRALTQLMLGYKQIHTSQAVDIFSL